jgi:GT2 family glycosyltransferase
MQDAVSNLNPTTKIPASSQPDSARILAIVVTYNRPERLAECIEALRGQSLPPTEILVVDHSDDRAAQDAVEALDGIVLIRQANSGGAGGFYRGMVYAWEAKFDWAWLMDDDVVPTQSALHELMRSPYARLSNTGFLSSRVVNCDGNTYMTPTPSHWWESANSIALDMCYRVSGGSFVGFLVNYRAIDKCGLPLREYFIYDDDIEYSERVARTFCGYCVLTSVVVHNQPKPSARAIRSAIDWKHLYLARNRASRIMTSAASPPRRWVRLVRHAAAMLGAIDGPSIAALKVPLWLLWGAFYFRPAIVFAQDSGLSVEKRGQKS